MSVTLGERRFTFASCLSINRSIARQFYELADLAVQGACLTCVVLEGGLRGMAADVVFCVSVCPFSPLRLCARLQ